MSEVRLHIIDAEAVIQGQAHGSIADAAVAALSAEPETIAELEVALARYIKPRDDVRPFAGFRVFMNAGDTAGRSLLGSVIDGEPWDAGVVIVDLAARIVAAESSYSQPQARGDVYYHDGTKSTDVAVPYRVPDDWLFLYSLAEYEAVRGKRYVERAANPPLDARAVLYGKALSEFIASQYLAAREARARDANPVGADNEINLVGRLVQESHPDSTNDDEAVEEAIEKEMAAIHASWLMNPREDLLGQTPREVLLAKREFIDFDLHTRELQWSFAGEGPPCLGRDSKAFRFAGFGTHECVVYYDLLRHLLEECRLRVGGANHGDIDAEIAQLETGKMNWLELPQPEYEGRIPALIIESERKRLPLALRARDMIVDEDCPVCQMIADDMAVDFGPGFWHLDGCNMDEDFAFSFCRTRAEWEAERRRMQEFNEEFNRNWERDRRQLVNSEQLSDAEQPVDPEVLDPEDQHPDLIQ